MFSVIEKKTARWIGRLGPWQPEGWPGSEVGWDLHPDAWGQGYAVAGAAGRAGLVPLRTWPSRRQVPPSATKWGPEESSRDLPRLCRSRQNREFYGLQGLRRGGGRSPQSARQR